MGRWFFWLDHMRNEGSSNPVNLLFVSKWQERGAAYSGLHATVLWWLQTLQRVWSICVLHPPKNHLVWLLRSSFQSVIVMDVVGIEIRREGEGWCTTVPVGMVHCWRWRRLGLQGRKKACRGALPAAGQEGRVFLLISCLIRLIHLLSLYREVYLTPKQATN